MRRGDELVLDGRGNAVIDIESLNLESNARCANYAAGVYVLMDYGDNVVINVRKHLELGDCSYITSDYAPIVINVPGRGHIHQGQLAYLDIPILAPRGSVTVVGSLNFDDPTVVTQLWVKNAHLLGWTYQGYYRFGCD